MSHKPAAGEGMRLYCEVDGIEVSLDIADLSPAGLFVQSTTMLEPDSEVDLFLRTPAGQLSAQAVVVQVISYERAAAENRKPGARLLFAELTEAQRELIDRSLRMLAESAAARRAAAQGSAVERAAAPAPPPRPATPPKADAARATPSQRPAGHKAKAARMAARNRAAEAKPPGRSREAAEALKRLREELDGLKHKLPAAILGLEPGADKDAARKAFFAASKRYHPHVFARFGDDEITQVVTQLFIAHKRAYNKVLQTAPERDAPPAASTPAKGQSVAPPSRPRAVRTSAQRMPGARIGSMPPAANTPVGSRGASSTSTARMPAVSRAAPHSSMARMPAVSTTGSNPGIPPTGGRAQGEADPVTLVKEGLRCLANDRFGDAEDCFKRALAQHGDSSQAALWLHLCRGRRARASGDNDGAVKHYRAALEFDPDNKEARDATGAGAKKGGLLGRLFKAEGG